MAKKFNKKGVEIEESVLEPMAEEAAVEAAEEAQEATIEAAPELVDFEEWYAQREERIPGHHHREILKADFKGRKVPDKATMAEFDEALKKYGVELA